MGEAVEIVLILQLWQLLPVYAGFLAAILNIVMISMMIFGAYCTIVFPNIENAGFPVAILNFLLISMSIISGDCTIVFPFQKTYILPFKSCRYVNFGERYKYFRFLPIYGRRLEFLAAIDVALITP